MHESLDARDGDRDHSERDCSGCVDDRSAAVLGTAPAWWSSEGGTATFLRIEQSNGTRIARVEWSDDGKFRALGGAAIPAPVVLLVRGEEAFDPANGSIVRITK